VGGGGGGGGGERVIDKRTFLEYPNHKSNLTQ